MSQELNFLAPRASRQHRMSRRAWFVVYGAVRVQNDTELAQEDIASRMNSLYHDIEPYEISGVIENYLQERRHM